MKNYMYILYVAVIALVLGSLYPVKRLDTKLSFRHYALQQVICSINDYGSGICIQLGNIGTLHSYYRSKPEVLDILSNTKYEYDLVVCFGGCISFERHYDNKERCIENIYDLGEQCFLGKILAVDKEDADGGRYLLGFENGQVAYVESNVYEALLKGEGCVCRMDTVTRCWVNVPGI